jgi:hypothetical protein
MKHEGQLTDGLTRRLKKRGFNFSVFSSPFFRQF